MLLSQRSSVGLQAAEIRYMLEESTGSETTFKHSLKAPVHACILTSLHAHCTITNLDDMTHPHAAPQSFCALKKQARSMRICSDSLYTSLRWAIHTHRQSKQVDHFTFSSSRRQICRFSRVVTGTRCVHSVLLWFNIDFLAKTELWSLHRLRSILSSYHPLPTTKWRLTLQRPEGCLSYGLLLLFFCCCFFYKFSSQHFKIYW